MLRVINKLTIKAMRGMKWLEKKAGVKEYETAVAFKISPSNAYYNQSELLDNLFEAGCDCEFKNGLILTFREDIPKVIEVLKDYGCTDMKEVSL